MNTQEKKRIVLWAVVCGLALSLLALAMPTVQIAAREKEMPALKAYMDPDNIAFTAMQGARIGYTANKDAVQSVVIDGKTLRKGTDYQVSGGETTAAVEFQYDYLMGLTTGQHTIAVTFADDKWFMPATLTNTFTYNGSGKYEPQLFWPLNQEMPIININDPQPFEYYADAESFISIMIDGRQLGSYEYTITAGKNMSYIQLTAACLQNLALGEHTVKAAFGESYYIQAGTLTNRFLVTNQAGVPKPTEPQPTEPQPTEPQPTEPEPTEPEPTEPEWTNEDLLQPIRNFKAVASPSGYIDISWDKHPKADFYRLYALGTSGMEKKLIYQGPATEFHDLDAVGVEEAYPASKVFNYYSVEAVQRQTRDGKVVEITSDDGTPFYTYGQALLKLRGERTHYGIQNLSVKSNKDGSIDVSWDKDKKYLYYVVCYIGELEDIQAGKPTNYYVTTGNTSCHFSTLDQGFHFFRVYGVRYIGGEFVPGPLHLPSYAYAYSRGVK